MHFILVLVSLPLLCAFEIEGGNKMCFLFSAWNVPRRGVIPDWECVC